MFAHAGLSGGQSGFGVKRRGAVPRVHLRGEVVGRFLSCRSGEWESIQHEKDHSVSHSKSSVQSSAPPQLSLYPSLKVSDLAQVVTGCYDRHSGSRPVCILSERGEGGAAATGVAGAMFAVRLPVTVTTSLRDGFTQTFRAP